MELDEKILIPVDESNLRSFFCCGRKRVLTNLQNSGALILATFLIVMPTIVYFSFILPYYYKETYLAILYILSISSFCYCLFALFDVATTIPGYLPKGNITKEDYDSLSHTTQISNETVYLKYCGTCKIVREPRSFHCSLCGRCIQRHDHHCGFVGNCIGKNNTDKFCYFIISVVIHTFFIFITTIIKCISITLRTSHVDWEANDFLAFFVLLISGIFCVTLLGLLCFHFYLITKNITTNEFIRAYYKEDLFDEGCNKNWREVFYK